MSALQSGVAAARKEHNSQPMPSTPPPPPPAPRELPPVPIRRVRGAQLGELGAETGANAEVPARDPAAIGRQLSGLQAATSRAFRETGRFHANDDDTQGNNK